jgi:hypothetical protein
LSKDQKDAFKVKMNDISVTCYFSIFINLGVRADPFFVSQEFVKEKVREAKRANREVGTLADKVVSLSV